jgi:peptidyl-prolyl cis-trans isomerase B (cyclophilin B)
LCPNDKISKIIPKGGSMRFTIPILLVAFIILAFGCKEEKEKVEPEKDTPPPVSEDTTTKAPEVPETITGDELAVIKMKGGGEIVMKFYYDDAPKTVENFIKLTRKGFYNGLTFHRIVPGFVVQGGDPLGTGTGNAGYNIDAEFNKKPFVPGVLGMARGPEPNSASCQFFICLTREKCKHLDGNYTAFGEVIKGMDVVKKIAKAKVDESGMPKAPIVMESVTIQMTE